VLGTDWVLRKGLEVGARQRNKAVRAKNID